MRDSSFPIRLLSAAGLLTIFSFTVGGQIWSPTTTLASGVVVSGPTTSATNDTGSSIVAWPERTASGAVQVRAAVRTNGGAWQAAQTAATAGANPVAAMAPNGQALVAWGAGGKIQASWFQNGAWGAPATLSASAAATPQIRVAFDAASVATVVAAEILPGYACALSVTTGTAVAGFAQMAPVSAAADCATTPSLAVNASGEALLGYLAAVGQGGAIMVASRNVGGTWQAPKMLAPAAYRQYGPAVALASNGVGAAAWRLSFGVGRATRSVTGLWSAATAMDTQFQPTDIDMAMDAAGNGIATWTTWNYATSGSIVYPIRYATVGAAGNWSAPRWMSSKNDDTWENHVSASPGGTFLTTWSTATPYNFKAATLSGGGAPSKVTLGSNSSWTSSASGQGNAVAAWTDITSYSKIFVRTAVMP